MRHFTLRLLAPAVLAAAAAPAAFAQAAAAPLLPPDPAPQQQQQPAGQSAKPAAGAPQTAPAIDAPRLTDTGGFLLTNASLTEMIDMLARRLKLNYVIDPGVKGSVSIYTYGEVKPVDLMQILETILRVNGAAMVKVGDLYRIVPIKAISALPLEPLLNPDPKTLPDDERMLLNLIFLKYATATEMQKLITPFLGEGASISTYEPANLLLLQDNSRSMKRTMELIALFDSDTFAGQRVKTFEITNSRPADLVKELESVFKAYALSEKSSVVKFIPVDRINIVIAVAPNPGIFTQVQSWIDKLDIPVKITAGDVTNYVYRLKYSRAETVAMAIMALYTGDTMALSMLGNSMNSGGMYGGGMGGGMYGGGMGGAYGGMGGAYGGMGGAYGGMGGAYGGGYGGGYGGMGSTYGGGGYGSAYGGGMYGAYGRQGVSTAPVSTPTGTNANPTPNAGPNDMAGSYLGAAGAGGQAGQRLPHVIPNPFDNTLLIQGTPQEYEQITHLLRQLDVAPRQVLVDAKIYEVDLSGALQYGVTAYLEKRNGDAAGGSVLSRTLTAASTASGMSVSAGALVLRSHQLLGLLQASEVTQHSKVISAPSIIATDSIPAVMNVGQDVPVLTSSGVAVTGSSFNSVSNRSTGVTLSIMARVNSSGVVTMIVDQDVTSPPTASTSGINSPSFQRRSFQTQITVQDGDTVAIGGFIQETYGITSSGVPFLSRIPVLGAAFGGKGTTRGRTELIVFLTPRVIYDTSQMLDATDEIKSNLKRVGKMIREER